MSFYFILVTLAFGAEVTSIDFHATTDSSEVLIAVAGGTVSVDKQDKLNDNQIILEVKDASISAMVAQPLDTSLYESNVLQVTPFQVPGTETVRIVVQLREGVQGVVQQEANAIRLKVPAPASVGPKTAIDNYISAQKVGVFAGKPVTLQVRDVPATDVLKMIGEASGFNMILSDDVKGAVTLSLVDVPWDQALHVVLQTLHLGAERTGNVLRIMPLRSLREEKEDEVRVKQAADAYAPKVTRIFPISFANIADIKTILARFGSSNPTNGGQGVSTTGSSNPTNGGQGVSTTVVEQDPRTNSLIVQDTVENLDRMKKIIDMLDTQTPQVMIEAKIIEASENFSNSLSGSLGLGSFDQNYLGSFGGGDPVDPLLGTPGVFATGQTAGTQSTGSGMLALSPQLGFLPGGAMKLNAILNLGESESQVKIVSSPKTVVLNKETASIVEGTPVLTPSSSFVAGVGEVPISSVQQANIGLTVVPTVTNEGSVMMQLTITKDIPVVLSSSASGIGNRKLTTKVLVDSGTTLVVGGIYSFQDSSSETGFPFLRKIPILGALFGSTTSGMQRTELFIFITPRVLNLKEAV